MKSTTHTENPEEKESRMTILVTIFTALAFLIPSFILISSDDYSTEVMIMIAMGIFLSVCVGLEILEYTNIHKRVMRI